MFNNHTNVDEESDHTSSDDHTPGNLNGIEESSYDKSSSHLQRNPSLTLNSPHFNDPADAPHFNMEILSLPEHLGLNYNILDTGAN